MTLALDAHVSLDTPDYDLDGGAYNPPPPPIPDAGGATSTPRRKPKRPEWRVTAVARCRLSSVLTAHGATSIRAELDDFDIHMLTTGSIPLDEDLRLLLDLRD